MNSIIATALVFLLSNNYYDEFHRFTSAHTAGDIN